MNAKADMQIRRVLMTGDTVGTFTLELVVGDLRRDVEEWGRWLPGPGDIPSLRHTWGDAALYVPPGDVNALEKTFELLTADEDLRERMSRRARRRSLTFEVTRMTLGYPDAYKTVVAARTGQCVS